MLLPSGEYCGLMDLAFGKTGTREIFRVSMSMSARCIGPYLSVSRFVSGPESVTNATVLPSGDHAGWICAYRSCVSCSWLPDLRSYRYRSLMPPDMPANTILSLG